ncbi:MAG: hypothetical protein IPO60_09580, partial [Flavobacteriales bacterium]|nr:hypothetical protein [Flavobacteriales bacterium]
NVDTTFAETHYASDVRGHDVPDKRDLAPAAHFEVALQRYGSIEGTYQLALARHRQRRFAEENYVAGPLSQ